MTSLTQWTWVWASPWSWWWTGKPGMLQSTGLQSNWTELNGEIKCLMNCTNTYCNVNLINGNCETSTDSVYMTSFPKPLSVCQWAESLFLWRADKTGFEMELPLLYRKYQWFSKCCISSQSLSHVWPFTTPCTVACQTLWNSQASILEWVAIPFSRGSSSPRDWTPISCIGKCVLYHWAIWEAIWLYTLTYNIT